jgi:hypothetical protein
MWNLGVDYNPLDRHSFNAHARGWHQMRIVAPFTEPNAFAYDTLGGATYLDISYLAKDVLADVDFRAFAGNVLDNTEPVGMVINNGVFHPRGRNIGFQLTKRF